MPCRRKGGGRLSAAAIRNLEKFAAITRTLAAGARSATKRGGGETVAEKWIMRSREKNAAGDP